MDLHVTHMTFCVKNITKYYVACKLSLDLRLTCTQRHLPGFTKFFRTLYGSGVGNIITGIQRLCAT